MSERVRVLVGDCIEQMRTLPDASIDAVVTDPPYGLAFMGKDWDAFGRVRDYEPRTGYQDKGILPSYGRGGTSEDVDRFKRRAAIAYQAWCKEWAAECLRLSRPGGHLLAFGGARTFHRLTCALEDAGFEIRDTLTWHYGQGMPKSLDVSRAIDAAAGAKRGVVGVKAGHEDFIHRADAHAAGGRAEGWDRPWKDDEEAVARSHLRTAPATPQAAQWDGWGTGLKPATEFITVARKPLSSTVAANVVAHGTGALNIDGCRVDGPAGAGVWGSSNEACQDGRVFNASPDGTDYRSRQHPAGRWPPNVLFSHAATCELVGTRRVPTNGSITGEETSPKTGGVYGDFAARSPFQAHGDGDGMETVEEWRCGDGCPIRELDRQSGTSISTGGVNGGGLGKHVYGAWANTAPAKTAGGYGDVGGASRYFPRFRYCAKPDRAERTLASGERNAHPTTKPVELVAWLVRLVTPPDGVVLDPFAGSGTTAVAALREGCRAILIEKEEEYLGIIDQRLEGGQIGLGL